MKEIIVQQIKDSIDLLMNIKVGLISFVIFIVFYQMSFSCECGALYHTDKERKRFFIHLLLIIILSIVLEVIF